MISSNLDVHIVDVVEESTYEKYLYKCLAPMPFRKYKKRHRYLKSAIPKGLRKKILFFKGVAVGQIEYAPLRLQAILFKMET